MCFGVRDKRLGFAGLRRKYETKQQASPTLQLVLPCHSLVTLSCLFALPKIGVSSQVLGLQSGKLLLVLCSLNQISRGKKSSNTFSLLLAYIEAQPNFGPLRFLPYDHCILVSVCEPEHVLPLVPVQRRGSIYHTHVSQPVQ